MSGPPSPDERRPERLDRRVIHRSPWVDLYVDRVRLPTGRVIDAHHVLHFEQPSVAAVIENDAGAILLIESYRYVTGTIEWELPAGRVDPGETVLDAARREVLEETGVETGELELFYSYGALQGIADIVHHLVRGRAIAERGTFDADEVRSVRWVAPDEIRDMIARRTLRDAYTLVGVLLHLAARPTA